MNKAKKTEYKKILVRNTEKPVSKSKVVIEESKTSLKTACTENIAPQKKPDKPIEKRCEVSETNLDLPELYSTLRISKKIDNVVKPRKTKSCSDVDKKLAVDEKVTKKVNFPYDQTVYKDLIPLTYRKVQMQRPPSRPPLPQKDIEPVLSDFLTPRQSTEKQSFYAPTVKVEIEPVIISCDNLRLYRTLQKYK
ncbi:uncharacterized protein LOC108908065 [Anoplophora glabripennis]|uniref:uncharacterized protein LOC108908065 n=1 Tax=Anoplophora glabripennis TaxID=217634 RepID=UPI0008748D2D|nr:uncharacterized protein LOC108908065 [Anoplophora glabripennis]XP_018567490.1 uncharacterized protein LOC108908065 [Anoplophora glabripennis]